MELEGAVEEEDEESDTEEIKNFAPENFIRDHVNIPPIYNDAASTDPTISGAFFHHQRLARTLKNRGQVPLTATEKASVELEASATRYNLSRCCDAVIRWGERHGSIDLPCFKTMKSVFDRVSDEAAPTELYRSLEIPINPAFSATGQTSLTWIAKTCTGSFAKLKRFVLGRGPGQRRCC